MKILTEEEVSRLIPVGHNQSNSSVRKTAFALKLGEVLFVSDADWKSYKYAKTTMLGSLIYNPKFKFTTRKNFLGKERGWAVKRIK